ncbi:MAG: 4-hydroxy-3-methylbut-2-enyl diphosphate reductase [Proteobacteria bacterium]|nr:4-hydroxy-3-methylbut-2-enyl diphosphate reductase [Pseudomonadota bacterium]
MKINIAKSAGYCFGVKRAINEAEKCREGTNEPIHTLGPIIHNPQAVKKLEDSEIYSKGSVEEIETGTVIIRSHGVKLEEYDKVRDKGLSIVDATCPFVKKAQSLVALLAKEGYTVIVVGSKEHPEVKGILSYGPTDVMVAETPEDLAEMGHIKKVGIVSQTTLPTAKLEAVVAYCVSHSTELKVYNTICNATSIRQEESEELARISDVVVVVGGRNSANTKRLVELCRTIQPRTHHIEVAAELVPEWFEGAGSTGVTSGASTPTWVIENVIEEIETITSN